MSEKNENEKIEKMSIEIKRKESSLLLIDKLKKLLKLAFKRVNITCPQHHNLTKQKYG